MHIFEFYDIKNGRRYTKDLIKIGFFELTKGQGLTTNQKHWLDYFNNGVIDTSAPEYIKKASNIIEFINLAEEEKIVVDLLEKAEADRVAEIHQGFLDGRQEGFLDGESNRSIKVAKIMLTDGEPIERIMRYTELSELEIKSLQTNVKYKRV